MKKRTNFLVFALFLISSLLYSQGDFPSMYNPVWTTRSNNSSESMPVGGGDIGLNVWVENGDLLFYMSRSGTFDENNEFVKLGRIRVQLDPNPFTGESFKQELILRDGYVTISGSGKEISGEVNVWIDVFRPVIHVDAVTSRPADMKVSYESWRIGDKPLRPIEAFANSYKWESPENLFKPGDSIDFDGNSVVFLHRNREHTIYDETLQQQGLYHMKDRIYNPMANLAFGGIVQGNGLVRGEITTGTYLDTDFTAWELNSRKASKKQGFTVVLQTEQSEDRSAWREKLDATAADPGVNNKNSWKLSKEWWNKYWDRSFIVINGKKPDQASEAWQVGRNYQLFRYMLGCNAYGSYPTKFNGGLFTYDPRFTDPSRAFTPDFRNWGGGTFTAQNQRLVYFPMLKSGDFDMMKPQLDFYKRIREAGEVRSEVYWGHGGACLTEQIDNFGLPNKAEYGLDRPEGFDPGLQYNNWLEYQWDTSLEFCLMALERYAYNGDDPSEYIELIMSVLRFFDEHYQFLAARRGIKVLDGNGHLVLYPGSACETYKMTYNSSSTIAGLKTMISRTLELPGTILDTENRSYLEELSTRIPDIEYRQVEGKTTISPARSWERVSNVEAPQLYPVFPWKIFGIGKPGLDTAVNTYFLDPEVQEFKSHVGWKQYGIWAANLGLADEAWTLTKLKMKDSGRRFPAFWGPGFDWVPDHNWGGSGMIGLQDMLLQEINGQILLFPAWPKDVDVHFKLHAPGNTVVEAEWKDGAGKVISVWPVERKDDVRIMNNEPRR